MDITSPAPPAGSPALAPGAASNQQTFSSPFPNQADLSLGASQTMSPITSQNSFQQNSFMNTSASLNNDREHGEHQGPRVVCNIKDCNKTFYDRSGLRKHVRSTHEGRKYTCEAEDCNQTFTTKKV